MTVDLLIELIWKSVLCAGAGLFLLRLVRRRSAAEQSLVANLALLALLLLPLGVGLLPELRFAAPESVALLLPEAPQVAPATALALATSAEASPALSMATLALALYLLPAALLLLGLLIGLFRLRRIRARAEVLVEPLWLTALARAQRRLGVKHGTALLASGELDSPVSWGLVRPVIILDEAAAGDASRAEAIIAHELAHVVRLDWARLLAGRLVVCLFWFNPLVWLLARQAHHLCEEAADDAVLRAEIGRHDYADVLLGAARHANRRMLLPANGVAPARSSLGRRIAHILDGSRPRRPTRLGWAAASLAGALAINVAIAAAAPVLAQPLGLSFQRDAGERAAALLERSATPEARAIGRAIRLAGWDSRRIDSDTRFEEVGAVAPLLAALRDDRAEVRAIAIWGLSEMRPTVGAEAAEPVAALLGDPAPRVRGQAARALGDFGAATYAEAIAGLLRDSDASVRVGAAHALGDLRNPAVRKRLQAALGDPDPAVRAKAAWALDELRESIDRSSSG